MFAFLFVFENLKYVLERLKCVFAIHETTIPICTECGTTGNLQQAWFLQNVNAVFPFRKIVLSSSTRRGSRSRQPDSFSVQTSRTLTNKVSTTTVGVITADIRGFLVGGTCIIMPAAGWSTDAASATRARATRARAWKASSFKATSATRAWHGRRGWKRARGKKKPLELQ
jgi:hypothetical protein